MKNPNAASAPDMPAVKPIAKAPPVWTKSVPGTALRILAHQKLRKPALRCIALIFYNFFFLQYKAALMPGRIPVSQVDHPLDKSIPFSPQWVGVYLDFISFWIRSLGFILDQYGDRGVESVVEFLDSIGALYQAAAEVYQKNLSTTKRPRYLKNPRFILIHAADPHLMCVPSLHVMVMINTYVRFRAILEKLGDKEAFAHQIEEIRRGAMDITQAILYVKQHSVNCIAAAMYAMTRFDASLFPPEEARNFAETLFADYSAEIPRAPAGRAPTARKRPAKAPAAIAERDRAIIRGYILERYELFLEAGREAPDWKQPLLDFLASLYKA